MSVEVIGLVGVVAVVAVVESVRSVLLGESVPSFEGSILYTYTL